MNRQRMVARTTVCGRCCGEFEATDAMLCPQCGYRCGDRRLLLGTVAGDIVLALVLLAAPLLLRRFGVLASVLGACPNLVIYGAFFTLLRPYGVVRRTYALGSAVTGALAVIALVIGAIVARERMALVGGLLTAAAIVVYVAPLVVVALGGRRS